MSESNGMYYFRNKYDLEKKRLRQNCLNLITEPFSFDVTIQTFEQYENWMFVFNISNETLAMQQLDEYFKQFTSLQFNSRVFAALQTDGQISFFDVYRKAPGLDVTVKEVLQSFFIWDQPGLFLSFFKTVTNKVQNFTLNGRNADGLLGIQTQDIGIVGVDKSIEVWWPPCNKVL